MKNFEEQYTRWLDGAMDDREREGFERTLEERGGSVSERAVWARLSGDLREALPPGELEHPDFLNAQVMRQIEADRGAAPVQRARLFPVGRLAFAGLALVAVAAVLGVGSLLTNRAPTEAEFISQVISARSADPGLSAYAFGTPGGKGAVLWIEDAGFIPGSERLK